MQNIKTGFHIHRSVVLLVNFAVVSLLIFRVRQIDSDKAPLLIIFYYPILTFLNLMVWMLLRLLRNKSFKIYRQSFFILLALLLPVLLLGMFL